MKAFKWIASSTLMFLISLFAIAAEAQMNSPDLFLLEGKSNMGILATQNGDHIRLVYNYHIQMDGSAQAIWKSSRNLSTQEEYVCEAGGLECVNTKYKELKLTRSKDGKSLRVVGPAGLMDYTFNQHPSVRIIQ